MQKIINYLMNTYTPETILVYGSYANETNTQDSDFDALIISEYSDSKHDISYIEDTQLDVFIYPPEVFENYFSPKDYIQVGRGMLLMDRNGLGKKLLDTVNDYIDRFAEKGYEELLDEVNWCEKMRNRILRKDPEGFFRWHLVLTESLEIYCDIKKRFYLGPNKALEFLRKEDPGAYDLYAQALENFQISYLDKWLDYLRKLID